MMMGGLMYCQYCGKQATAVGILITKVEHKLDYAHPLYGTQLITTSLAMVSRTRILAETELVGFCDEHDHYQWGDYYSPFYLKCRLTPEVKKEIEKVIQVQKEDVEHNRSVKVDD